MRTWSAAMRWLLHQDKESREVTEKSCSIWFMIFNRAPIRSSYSDEKLTITKEIRALGGWAEIRRCVVRLSTGEVVFDAESGLGWEENKILRPGAWQEYLVFKAQQLDVEHQPIDDSELFSNREVSGG